MFQTKYRSKRRFTKQNCIQEGGGDNGHKFTLNDRYVKTGYFVCLSLFLLTPRLRLENLKSSRSGKNSRMIFEKYRENAFFPCYCACHARVLKIWSPFEIRFSGNISSAEEEEDPLVAIFPSRILSGVWFMKVSRESSRATMKLE